jgi:hypothetical protein
LNWEGSNAGAALRREAKIREQRKVRVNLARIMGEEYRTMKETIW